MGFTSGRPASTDAYVSEASCIDDTMRKLQRARNICLHPDSISGVKEKFFFFFSRRGRSFLFAILSTRALGSSHTHELVLRSGFGDIMVVTDTGHSPLLNEQVKNIWCYTRNPSPFVML